MNPILRYYSLNFSGPPGAEKRSVIIEKQLKRLGLRSLHEYGMVGGDLYRFVCSPLSPGELFKLFQDKAFQKKPWVIPNDIVERSPHYMTFRGKTIAAEFAEEEATKPKRTRVKYNKAHVTVCLGDGKWPSSKFNIGDAVRWKGDPEARGKVQYISVYPATRYVFAYWVKGVGPSDIPEDELILVKRGAR